MPDKLLKGFSLATTLHFIDKHYTHDERGRILAQLAPLLDDRTVFKKGDWYPIEHQAAMLRAMASVTDDPDKAYQNAVQLGRFLSEEASNTFMRLLFKVLTPVIFLRKAPSVWSRMFNFGDFEVDTSRYQEGKAHMLMRGVAGFDYVAPVSVGWIASLFAAVGCADADVSAVELDEGGAPGNAYRFDIQWTV